MIEYETSAEQAADVLRRSGSTERGETLRTELESEDVSGLLRTYAAILAELRSRGVIRTNNAPLGDYAEYLVARAYEGVLAANSAKSFDVGTGDGRRLQVKARTIGPKTSPSAVFSVFRTFDFDAAVVLVFDSETYELLWAREVSPEAIRENARWSGHVNGHVLRVAVAGGLGEDVTERFGVLDS